MTLPRRSCGHGKYSRGRNPATKYRKPFSPFPNCSCYSMLHLLRLLGLFSPRVHWRQETLASLTPEISSNLELNGPSPHDPFPGLKITFIPCSPLSVNLTSTIRISTMRTYAFGDSGLPTQVDVCRVVEERPFIGNAASCHTFVSFFPFRFLVCLSTWSWEQLYLTARLFP